MAGLSKTRKHRQKHKYLSVEYKNGKWSYHYKAAKPTSRKKNVTGSSKVNKSNMTVGEMQAVNLVKDELDSALHGTWGKKKKKSKKKLSLTNRNRANKNGRVPKMSHNNHQNNELMHRQKGAQNKNHKYLSRIVKNGKYVYDYGTKKAGQAAAAVKTAAGQAANAVSTAATGAANTAVRKYNNYNSAAAKQSRERSRRLLQVRTQKKIAKGRAKVNSIVEQLKRQASGKISGYKSAKQSKERQKRLNQINKQKQKSAKAFNKALKRTNTSLRNASYEYKNLAENYVNGTSNYKSASQIVKENEKKYKKRAQMQKRTKRKIATEQAIGKVKRTVKKATSKKK